jgi:hypothetical protein
VALFEQPDGYEPLGDESVEGLAREPWAYFQGVEQLANKVRERFRPVLGDFKHTDFIQIVDRRVRLSTHASLVSFDRSWLMEHPNHVVREFAKRLPASD